MFRFLALPTLKSAHKIVVDVKLITTFEFPSLQISKYIDLEYNNEENHMKLFRNRYDKKYLATLKNDLSVDRLIQTSFPISPYREQDEKIFSKCCRIDFMGLSATTLLDVGSNFAPSNIAALQFEELIKNASKLNSEGIFLKIRFLFSYPFSTSFMSLIQAESTVHRSSVETPSFLRDFRTIDEVDEDTFMGSSTVQNQRNSLEQLQHLIEDYRLNEQTVNSIRIRFTPIDVNFCMLIVNNFIYYDEYLYSKTNHMNKKLALCAPLVCLDQNKDVEAFKHFEDHFRYIWDLDTTLVSDDATHYSPGVPYSLRKLKQPGNITYDFKANRIRSQRKEQSGVDSTDEEIRSWKFRVRHILNRYAFDTKLAPNIESVFIACSWQDGNDGRSSPNEYAQLLKTWLDKDFGSSLNSPIMSTHILEAEIGGSLSNQIYLRLKKATMAIIILTADIKTENGDTYTKPNVYHELGYLMRQIDSSRLVVLKEGNVHVPSNISDVVRIDLAPQKLALCYRDVVNWVRVNCYLTNADSIKYALVSHIERLEEMILKLELDQTQGKQAIDRIQHMLGELSQGNSL